MKKKLISCKSCGEEIAKKAKKCPHCGAKNKKPFFKKWWFWLIVIIMIGSCGGNSTSETEQTPTTPPTTQAPTVETAEPTTEPTTEVTTEPIIEEETLSGAQAAELVMAMIELSIADTFDYYKVEGDETGITLSVATNGLAKDMVDAKSSGYDEDYEPWKIAKENMVDLCDTIYDSAVEFGMNDPVISLMVLNDQNYDNILIGIMNGVVIYDAMTN